jgi:biopolymer transport protein ExbB
MSEQLRLALANVPGNEERSEKLETLEKSCGQATPESQTAGDLRANGPRTIAATLELFELLDATHAELYAVERLPTQLFTQSGTRTDATLLRAGHVAFAYDASGAKAVALKHAEGKVGYRWTENLSEDAQTALDDAFGAEPAALVALPFDVSGKLTTKSLERHTSFEEVLRAGGLVMLPLLLVALASLFLIIERTVVLYRQNRSGALGSQVLESARREEFETAEKLCQEESSALSRSLAAVLKRRASGREAMEDSMQEQLLHELPRLSRFIGGIAVLAAIAPLLGLLGTVTGIIKTFRTLRSVGHSNIELLAGGRSDALTTTAAGLIVAIPVLIIHSVLKGRVERILSDAERHGATLVNTIAR